LLLIVERLTDLAKEVFPSAFLERESDTDEKSIQTLQQHDTTTSQWFSKLSVCYPSLLSQIFDVKCFSFIVLQTQMQPLPLVTIDEQKKEAMAAFLDGLRNQHTVTGESLAKVCSIPLRLACHLAHSHTFPRYPTHQEIGVNPGSLCKIRSAPYTSPLFAK
jgi:hypothetical protein